MSRLVAHMSGSILDAAASESVGSAHGVQSFHQWRDRIDGQMEESVGLKWCALVDPAAHPELPGLLWEFRGDEEICPLFMNTMLSEVSLGGPLFTVLQPFGKITEWFLSNAEMSAVGVLYAVPEGRENALFEHLQNLLETPLPSGGTGLFRFYDPRVLHAVHHFPDRQWSRLTVGPAQSRHAWEPGRAEAVELRDGTPEILTECRREPMPQELADFMAAHNRPYAVLHAVWTTPQGERFRESPLSEAFPFVEAVCRSLAELGVSGFRDQVTGTLLCLKAARNVFEDEALAEWMNAARGRCTLPEGLAGMLEGLTRKHGIPALA
jgi:hypothetical protein